MYVYTHLNCGCEQGKRNNVLCLLNEAFLVKIANSSVMSTLRGFRWYPYFVAQE